MRRLLVVPLISVAAFAGVVVAGAAGAAPESGRDVAKTTIGPAPTQGPPTAPLPTAPVPTAPAPTAPLPTAGVPTVPLPPLPATNVPTTGGGVPTTEAAGLSPEILAIALPIFGLDPTTLQCIDTALPPFGTDDNAAVAALQGCGVPLMPILRGMVDVAQRSNTFLDPTATTIALPPAPGVDALPPEEAFFIGFMLLLQPEQISCLATGLAGATSEDDPTALAIVQRCEVPLGLTLDMLTFALVGDAAADPATTTTSVITTPPVPTVPVASGVATTVLSVSPDDPLVDQFQDMLLAQQGITLDDQQAACLLSHIQAGGINEDDMSALFDLMESCGITLTDLVPS